MELSASQACERSEDWQWRGTRVPPTWCSAWRWRQLPFRTCVCCEFPSHKKMANASTKFSSFLLNGRSLNLLISGMTLICQVEFLMAMYRMFLCLKFMPSSALGSKRGSIFVCVLYVDRLSGGSYVFSNADVDGKLAFKRGRPGLPPHFQSNRSLQNRKLWKNFL